MAQGFIKQRVNELLDLLERIVEGNNRDATRVYNIDETVLTRFQKKPRRVLSMKGRSKIVSFSSGERGVDTTAVSCVSAADCYVPPMLIYKRARFDDFKVWAPPGNVVAFNPKRIYVK